MSDRDLFDKFPGQQILVIGDVMLDEYLSGDCSRISPEAPVPIVTVTSSRTVLGGAANTSHNITALAGHSTLIGSVGADEAGRQFAALAASAGIDFVPVHRDQPTIRKVRVVGQQQQLVRLDYESPASGNATIENDTAAAIKSHLPTCSMVVISDYAKGLLTEALCQRVIAMARAAGKRVIVDPRPQHASFYRGCDYLTPNWKEALGLLGRPDTAPTPQLIDAVGRELADRFQSCILLTMGAKGITFFDKSGSALFSEPAVAREVFDVSGAGDTVVAAFSLALAAGGSERESIVLANRAAGIAVGKLGTATVSLGELRGDGSSQNRLNNLLDRAQLSPLAATLRSQGKRIVTINGSFDILHSGHLHILREAREQGDVLIVGVNSDRSVRAYKGADRPFVGERERAEMLLALRYVDYVHIFDEEVPMPFLEEVKPHVHVNGAEYGADCIEAPLVRSHGGRIHIVEKVPGVSTTALAGKVRK
jgi:D-beta-D-heptose 7-phosphate kinase/D-beta-D-heptose 1-phosphate adenosyltransferase